jgi:hypothetical protein
MGLILSKGHTRRSDGFRERAVERREGDRKLSGGGIYENSQDKSSQD